jgi:hypothetical protein
MPEELSLALDFMNKCVLNFSRKVQRSFSGKQAENQRLFFPVERKQHQRLFHLFGLNRIVGRGSGYDGP